MTTVYRIKCLSGPRAGLFSTGGSTPRWSKRGKLWPGKGPLSSHLGLVRKECYKDCVVVTYELTEVEISTESVQDVIQQKMDRKAQQQEEKRLAHEAALARKRKALYDELKAEFGEK